MLRGQTTFYFDRTKLTFRRWTIGAPASPNAVFRSHSSVIQHIDNVGDFGPRRDRLVAFSS
jgi:hypothetical protein